ncbi:MAG: alkaline phosphatase family protein [Gammaproteobacteria bacterium]
MMFRALAAGLLLMLVHAAAAAAPARSAVVLGVDGLDPGLVREYLDRGLLPNIARVVAGGGFIPLGTANPPQSPVAWSNFITGMDPGGHGLFDFIAVDRRRMLPYLSSARVEGPARAPLAMGGWRIPLGAERTVLQRHGTAFWELLDGAGVDTTIFQMPANYPPVHTGGRAISGMGTPDLRGTPGTFTLFTDAPGTRSRAVSGGLIRRVAVRGGVVRSRLEGPPNGFRDGAPHAAREFEVYVDPEHPVAMVSIEGREVMLRVGEWSDWVEVGFQLVPGLVRVPGMVRFYLQRTEPHFALFVSPVNIDPRDPAQPIADPESYARELAGAAGPFYTQEMPENSKALQAHVIDPFEFLAQSQIVLDERRRLLDHELDRLRAGDRDRLLFFYFSTVDQRHHMLYRQGDPDHPHHEAATPPSLSAAMRDTYVEIDAMVGRVLERIDGDTLLVIMSDHGFAPFRRQAHLNAWLEQHGYLKLLDPARRGEAQWLKGIDWSATRAYAIGLNSLYLNVAGRENSGIVAPAGREALARRIAAELAQWTDPQTGERVVANPALREDIYHGPYLGEAPDIIVGYARGYRASWDTTSGKVAQVLLEDNLDEWSGDHCMDPRAVPGTLIANRPLRRQAADLRDLPVTLLRYFGAPVPAQMRGEPVL